MLCNTCIPKSKLGDIVYGASGLIFIGDILTLIVAARAAGGMNNIEDTAGVIGGFVLAQNVLNARFITSGELCQNLNNNQTALITAIAAIWGAAYGPNDEFSRILSDLSGIPLADMGRNYKDCPKCKDHPLNMGHSSFAWFTSQTTVTPSDWKKTWIALPVTWPPGL